MQDDIFAEVFDGAVDEYFDTSEATDEEKEFQEEEKVTPSIRTDIENLLSNGAIFDEFEIAGHVFVIRTLKIGEELSVAEICKDYEGTIAEAKAMATATVAAAIETIDGRPLMRNLGPDSKNNIRQKFGYVRNKWYWIIIGEIYERYLILVNRQINAFSELRGK